MNLIHFKETNKNGFVSYKTQPIVFLLGQLALTVQYSIQSTHQAIQWSIILKLHPNYPETGRGWHPASDGSEDQVVFLCSLNPLEFLVALSLLYSRVLTFLPSPNDRETKPIGAHSPVRKRLAILKSFPIP